MKKLMVVADWATDSLTCQEVRSSIEGYLKNQLDPNIHFIETAPSTINTAFILSQVIQTEEVYGRPANTVIFQNTDPRINAVKKGGSVPGSQPLILKLASGIYVIGPNSIYTYSLIKHKIEEAFVYKNLDETTQFQSRDLYARISAHFIEEMEDEMELEETSTSCISMIDGFVVGHIDNFGNIKTTVPHEYLKGKVEFGEKIKITIGSVQEEVSYVPSLFGGNPGELVMYPGSSGPKDNRYVEVSVWRYFTEENPTTGSFHFNYPRLGAPIKFKL